MISSRCLGAPELFEWHAAVKALQRRRNSGKFSEAMSGPLPRSPTSLAVCTEQWSSGQGRPLCMVSGLTGPPVTYGQVRPMGASEPGASIARLWRSLGTWTTREPWFEFLHLFLLQQ